MCVNFCLQFVSFKFHDVSSTCRFQCRVIRRFQYTPFPVLLCYTPFPLHARSTISLLHEDSVTHLFRYPRIQRARHNVTVLYQSLKASSDLCSILLVKILQQKCHRSGVQSLQCRPFTTAVYKRRVIGWKYAARCSGNYAVITYCRQLWLEITTANRIVVLSYVASTAAFDRWTTNSLHNNEI